MKVIIALALALAAIGGCSSYRNNPAGAGGTGPAGDFYDRESEAATHNSAL
jgi:hypothetical protein